MFVVYLNTVPEDEGRVEHPYESVSRTEIVLSNISKQGLLGDEFYFKVVVANEVETNWYGPVQVESEAVEIIVDQVVYTVVKQVDRFIMLPVGTVASGTECIADQTVNGYKVIPRSAVQWSGSVRPDVVVAVCSEN